MATKGQARVARPLMFLLLLLAGLFSYVLIAGLEPRQGLDLRGGTSVILIPDPSRPAPSGGSLEKAVDIIRQRVDATGVAESEVVVEGGNIRVALPDVGRDDALKLVGTTAELAFRHVEQVGAPSPVPPASPEPVASGTPSARPSGSPSVKVTNPTPTATANKRPVPAALLDRQAGTPSPTASPTTAPSPTASPAASPAGEPLLTAEQAPVIFATVDCTDPKQANVGQRFAPDAQKIVACDRDGTAKYLLGAAEMKGTDVKSATATIDTSEGGTGAWLVQLVFTGKGSKLFGALTQKYVNQQVAIVLDGVVQSAPNIESAITEGRAQISGPTIKAQEARELANVLKYGALPVVFDQSEGQTQTISPTLGKESLDAGLTAGLLGLALVVLYSILYYRALGVVTVVGLLIFAAFNYLLIVLLGELIGFTLSLAGIAGLIVSIGISADSYVVFYERLKDEAREGRTLRQSVERGFKRAFATLLAADFVSLLAAATLYVLSIGSVRGFAFTLGMATFLDIFMAWFYTRPVVTLLARSRWFAEGRFAGVSVATAPAAPREA